MTTSIKAQVKRSYIFIILMMLLPTFYFLTVSTIHSRRYDKIITNISRANEINSIVDTQITNELWNVVSGRITFAEGRQFDMMNAIVAGIASMMTESSGTNVHLLQVATRANLTLYKNVQSLGEQIQKGASVKQNELALDEIRGIASLLSDVLQQYIIAEVQQAEKTNEAIKKSSMILTLIQGCITLLVLLFSFHGISSLTETIRLPIAQMEGLSSRIAGGDLSARLSSPQLAELNQLAENLNIMAGKIDDLIKQNIEEQKNLQKAEMKTLQAQITPHFLYNTFDTIIWLAEEEQMDDVIKVTQAFSEFLRISLSRGHEWITVGQELEHVRNYLTIQKIRYSVILQYSIEVQDGLENLKMLKLSLQPLVENAIYHGIKNKRGRGHIKVTASFSDEKKTSMTFCIEDDGAGFSADRLNQVQEELKKSFDNTESLSSFGLYNVNKRLLLYYNNQTDGLHIESVQGRSTKVYFTLPCVRE